MDALLPVAGLVAVGAITPGPNNLVVMRAAARTAVAVAGALYLAWLGAKLVLGTLRWPGRSPLAAAEALPGTARPATGVPGVAALFAFQFLNPKSRVMVSTAAAMAAGDGLPALLALALVFALLLLEG
jgi:threonine/homoserine/homoserine lactone efflux protein